MRAFSPDVDPLTRVGSAFIRPASHFNPPWASHNDSPSDSFAVRESRFMFQAQAGQTSAPVSLGECSSTWQNASMTFDSIDNLSSHTFEANQTHHSDFQHHSASIEFGLPSHISSSKASWRSDRSVLVTGDFVPRTVPPAYQQGCVNNPQSHQWLTFTAMSF